MRALLLSVTLAPALGLAQSVDYEWLATACSSVLNCDSGCTACNRATNASTTFTGNDAVWLGIDVCPHPVVVGDNALFTYGWPAIPDEQHMILVTGIAFTPMRIDSVILRHRFGTDGPHRLRVRFGANESMPQEVVCDAPVPSTFGYTTITDLGEVAPHETQVYGFFSLLLQPYQGEGGSWDLDELRIVGSPAETTGMADLRLPAKTGPLPRFDALGRPVLERRSVRFYLDGTQRVVLE